jgi:uncharacterized membrane protein
MKISTSSSSTPRSGHEPSMTLLGPGPLPATCCLYWPAVLLSLCPALITEIFYSSGIQVIGISASVPKIRRDSAQTQVKTIILPIYSLPVLTQRHKYYSMIESHSEGGPAFKLSYSLGGIATVLAPTLCLISFSRHSSCSSLSIGHQQNVKLIVRFFLFWFFNI